MPIDTTPLTLLTLAASYDTVISRVNEAIEIVNGLPASVSGTITRLGGTIDGSVSGTLLVGDAGTLFVIDGGGVGIGDFLEDDEETTVSGLLNVLKNTGYANVYIDSDAAAGGGRYAATLMLRDIGLANNYVKLVALPDPAAVAGVGSGRESLVPVIVHTHMSDSGADLEYQELMRLERQSTAALASGQSQAGYIAFRHTDGDSADNSAIDSVRLVARQTEGSESSGIFEVWVESSGTIVKGFTVTKDTIQLTMTTEAEDSASGSLIVHGGLGVAGDVFVASTVHVEGTDDAAHSTDGAVEIAGGVGIAKQLWSGANTNVGTNLTVTSNLVVSGTADSAHSTDGALTIAGGAAVARKLHVGTTITADALEVTGSAPLMGAIHSPRGWIGGMVMNLDGDGSGPTYMDINITAGECRDFANGNTCVLSSEITKQIDAIWAPGDDAGGFPSTGITRTDLTWYRVFIIRAQNGDVDAGFDNNEWAQNLIAEAVLVDGKWTGATYRQIGWVLNVIEASGVLPFRINPHQPEYCAWDKPSNVDSGGSNSPTVTTPVAVDVVAPPYTIARVYTSHFRKSLTSSINYPFAFGPTGTTGYITGTITMDNSSFVISTEGPDRSGDQYILAHHDVEVGNTSGSYTTSFDIHYGNATSNMTWIVTYMGFYYGRQRNE